MKTELIYQSDGYLREFEAHILSVDPENRRIALDRSAFYPGGGGQPCDTGQIIQGDQVFQVLRVQKDKDGLVWHQLGGEGLPENGSIGVGRIDWDHRYQLMRTHTALHILCGVVFRDYAAQVTGGDMEPLKGRMDFEFESLQKEFVGVIEASINREVELARPITVKILPRDEAFKIPDLIRTKINLLPEGISHVRVVHIEGLDLQADGGTHVNNTQAVGPIRITDYKSKGKINKRIYIELES